MVTQQHSLALDLDVRIRARLDSINALQSLLAVLICSLICSYIKNTQLFVIAILVYIPRIKMVRDRTHDVSCVDYHIKDLKKFGDEVEKAANSAFPSSTSRYREVHVLMLSWERDTLGVMKEIIELRDLFKDVYQYDVEEWVIPNEHAHNALRKRINRFLDEFDEREGNLLIVYYGGRKLSNSEPCTKNLFWLAITAFRQPPTILWLPISLDYTC